MSNSAGLYAEKWDSTLASKESKIHDLMDSKTEEMTSDKRVLISEYGIFYREKG